MECGGDIVQVAMQFSMLWLETSGRMNLFSGPNFSDQDLLVLCNEAVWTDHRCFIITYAMNYFMIFRAMVISHFAIFLYRKFSLTNICFNIDKL